MNSSEAKRILQIYRPDGHAAEQRFFQEALEQAQRDPELAAWLESERAWDEVVRGKLREAKTPADLKPAILAACATARCQPWWKRPPVLALVICLALGLLVLALALVSRLI
ncbi:MAG: hypothetical protein V1746_08685 [bacterium]